MNRMYTDRVGKRAGLGYHRTKTALKELARHGVIEYIKWPRPFGTLLEVWPGPSFPHLPAEASPAAQSLFTYLRKDIPALAAQEERKAASA